MGKFLPPNSPKNENFKKNEKRAWRYHRFIVSKIMIIYYTIPEIWHMTNVIVVFHFGLLFALLPPVPPLTAQKIQLKKKNENKRYHQFTHVYQKLWLDDARFLRQTDGEQQTDGQTDRLTKVTHRSGCSTTSKTS